MNRRGFLSGILATGMAPAVVGSSILMPLGKVWVPDLSMNATELWWMQHDPMWQFDRIVVDAARSDVAVRPISVGQHRFAGFMVEGKTTLVILCNDKALQK